MSRLSTAGTFSCAMIAVSGFTASHKKANELYVAGQTKEAGIALPDSRGTLSVKGFYNDVLYPTRQELGETKEYPFSKLMEEINNSSMNSKLITTMLNSQQQMTYWPEELERHGFSLVDITENDIGGTCYLYIRNKNRKVDYVVGSDYKDLNGA